MTQYGLPYMGSKAKIIPSLALLFPKAKNFYDLFGGGGAVTHYMALHKKHRYEQFYFNEIKADIVELIKRAINGEYNYDVFKPRWISREDFFANLDDPYVRCCWSFGNNQKGYLFGSEIEQYKKTMHMAVVFDEFDDLAIKVFGFDKWPKKVRTIKHKRFYLRQKIEFFRKTKIPQFLLQYLSERQLGNYQKLQQLERLQQLQQLQQLQPLERLEQLQQLQQLERSVGLNTIKFTSFDYRQVDILPDSIVYCDIPYQGTSDYGSFDHDQFFDWAATRKFPLYISEYDIKDSRFECVYEIDKRAMFKNSNKIVKSKSEKVYWNKVSL